MQTKNKYEEMIFREIQEMPKSMLPRILKILQILRESIQAPESFRKNESGSTGLAGYGRMTGARMKSSGIYTPIGQDSETER